MYVIVLGIFIIKLQISVSDPQFPAHVDFLKVGETIFNNEKFNILKTTTHVITDHFKEFMLRSGRESPNHPAKSVFIDTNGFRHEWSGFGEKTKSLRKTDLKYLRGSFEVASEDTLKSGTIATNGNVITTDTVKMSSENKEDEKINTTENNVSVQNLTIEANETDSKDTASTIHSLAATRVKNSSNEITIEERLRNGKKDNKTPAKVEAKTAGNKTPAKVETKTVGNKTPAKVEAKPVGNKTPAKVEAKPVGNKTPAKVEAKPVGNKTPAKVEEKKVGNKTPAKVEEKKVDNKTPAKVEEKKVDNKTPAKVEEKKVDNKTPAKVEEKKVDNKTPAKVEEKKVDDKNNKTPAKVEEKKDDKSPIQGEKTVMQTTFFCPYLGVITMSRFIDL